jgi:hypothetical protein
MSEELLSANEAAQRLGIAVASLYDWLAQSDRGTFVIRGQALTIDYLQGGPRGQGRIKLAASEVERIKQQMRVLPMRQRRRSAPVPKRVYPGIVVPLGRPDR